MNGQKVFKFATSVMPAAIEEVLRRANLTIDDVQFIVPHQANLRIIKYAAKRMGLPLERFQVSITHTGNSSSACIPMTLCDAYANGNIHPGDKVTLVEPSILPDAMIDPVCAVLADAPGVGSAYLSVMIVNGDARSYLLVLDGPKDEKLFASVAQAARPYLLSREKKMDLNITTSISPLGQQGMQGSEPFYRKGIGRVIEEDDDE